MAAQWMVAQDTFAGDLPDGSGFTVLKGQHLRSTDAVVKLAGGLFLPAEGSEEEPPPEKAAARKPAGKAAP